jgi:hypothetical protein
VSVTHKEMMLAMRAVAMGGDGSVCVGPDTAVVRDGIAQTAVYRFDGTGESTVKRFLLPEVFEMEPAP